MIQRYSLATTRQLELSCIASTSTFLLPFFSNPILSQRSTSSLSFTKSSNSRRKSTTSSNQKYSGKYGDVLGWMENQVEQILGKEIESVDKSRETKQGRSSMVLGRDSTYMRAGMLRGRFSMVSRRSYSSSPKDDLSFEERERMLQKEAGGKDSCERKGKSVKVEEKMDSSELKHKKHKAAKQKGWKDSPLPHPPDDLASHSDPITLESRIPSRSNQYLPLFPSNLTRKDLMSLISNIPSTANTSYLLRVRSIIIEQKLIDDSGPVILFVRACIDRNLDYIALRFMKEAANARKRSKLSNSTFFDSPLRVLVKKENWEAVVAFSSAALLHSTSFIVLKLRMRALYETRQYSKAVATFELFRECLKNPDGDCFDDLLGAHLMSGNLNLAQATLSQKQELGYPTTARTAIALLDGMWTFGGNRVMEEKVLKDVLRDTIAKEKALRQDVRILNRIMSVRAARGDIEDALAVLVFYDLSKITQLIEPLSKTRLPATTRSRADSSFFKKPTDRLSNPSNHFIVSNKGNKPGPDISTIVILISLYLRLEQPQNAINLFVAAHNLKLGLNEHLITSLVKVCLAAGKNSIQLVEEFVFALPNGNAPIPGSKEVVQEPFEPTAMVYEVLLAGVLRSGGLEAASAFLNRMIINRKRSIVITEGIVDVIVNHLSLDLFAPTSTKEIADFILRIQSMTNDTRRPTIKNLNAMLQSVWRKSRFQKVGGRRKKVKQIKLPLPIDSIFTLDTTTTTSTSLVDPNAPSPLTTNSIVPSSSSSSTDIPTSTARIRRSLADRGVQNDRSTTQQVLRNDKAFATVDSMWDYLSNQLTSREIQPTYQHIAIIIRSYIRLGDLEGARNVLNKCHGLGVNLHVSLYSVLISGAGKLGHPEIAKDLYREMKREGILPDRILYASLALECARSGDVAGVDSIISNASKKLETPLSSIDPIFTLIRYRALITNGRISSAQRYMAAKLKEGLEPDLATLKTVYRTVRWLTRKSSGRNKKRVSKEQEDTLKLAVANLSVVKSRIGKKRRMGVGQLKAFTKVLELSRARIGINSSSL